MKNTEIKTPIYIWKRYEDEKNKYKELNNQVEAIKEKIICLSRHLSSNYYKFSDKQTTSKDNLINNEIDRLRKDEYLLQHSINKIVNLWITREKKYFDF